MKNLIILIISALMICSCAESKNFRKHDGSVFTAEPYGWANYHTRKVEGVKYEINAPNLILSIVFAETIIAPVLITGYNFFEPVFYIESDTTEINNGIESIGKMK